MDEFSTPLDKLPSLHPVSTREEGGNPPADSLSYEDLIRDQQSMPQQSMPQQSMPQQSMPQQPMPQQPMPQQPMPQQPMQYHGEYSDYEDEYDPRPRPRRGSRAESNVSTPSNPATHAGTSWIVTKLKTHKNDILATGLTLALLTVIIPRMRTMARFENGIPLVAMVGISVAFASVLNTVTCL
jgi:hypothetical protein